MFKLKIKNFDKEKCMKRTLFTCLILLAVCLGFFVSCNAETVVPDDGIAYIRFGEAETRSFSASYDPKDYEELFWFYTATKTDGYGTTGQTAEGELGAVMNPYKDDNVVFDTDTDGLKGATAIGPFSKGDWRFTLVAYQKVYTTTTGLKADSYDTYTCYYGDRTDASKKVTIYLVKTDLIYKTEKDIEATLLSGETKNLAASVTPAAEKGYVEFGSGNNSTEAAYFQYAVKQTITESGKTAAEPYFKIVATLVDNGSVSKTFSNDDKLARDYAIDLSSSDDQNYKITFTEKNTIATLETGVYKCVATAYLKDSNGAAVSSSVAEVTFHFAVYGGATTTIVGFLGEDVKGDTVNFVVAPYVIKEIDLSEYATDSEKSVISDENEKSKQYYTSSAEVKEGDDETSVSALIPSSVLPAEDSDCKAKQYYVNMSVHNKEVAGQTAESFGIVDNLSGSVMKSVTVKVTDETGTEVEDLKKGMKEDYVYISINIGTGYKKEKLGIAYKNADGTIQDDFEVVSYTNGVVTFKTSHLSEFFILDKTKYPVTVKSGDTTSYYTTLEEALEKATTESTITLQQDVKVVTDYIAIENKTLTLNLNGKTLTAEPKAESGVVGLFKLKNSSSLTINGGDGAQGSTTIGTIKTSSTYSDYQTFRIIDKEKAENDGEKVVGAQTASLTLNYVTVDAPLGIAIKEGGKNITVKIENSTIEYGEGCYGVTTNAATAGENVKIDIKGSKILLRDNFNGQDTTGLLTNVPTTVTITNSEIVGNRQGAILRGGTYTIEGSTFKSSGTKTTGYDWTDTGDNYWSVGNGVPLAALVIGNKNKAYGYPTTVTFEGTNTLGVGETDVRKQIWVYQANKLDKEDRTVTVKGTMDKTWTTNADMNGAKYPEARIGSTDYDTIAAAIATGEENPTIEVLRDIDLSNVMAGGSNNGVEITKSLTLNGNNHTLVNTKALEKDKPLVLIGTEGNKAADISVVVDDLNIVNTGIARNGSYARLMNIWGISNNGSVKLSNVNLSTDNAENGTNFSGISMAGNNATITLNKTSVSLPNYYAVYIPYNKDFADAKTSLVIENGSVLSGWITIYNKASNVTVTATNSTFVSENVQTSGGSYNSSSSVIVSSYYNDNNTSGRNEKNTMTFTGCKFDVSKVHGSDVTQKIADLRSPYNNVLNLNNCTYAPAEGSQYFYSCYDSTYKGNVVDEKDKGTNKINVDSVDITCSEKVSWYVDDNAEAYKIEYKNIEGASLKEGSTYTYWYCRYEDSTRDTTVELPILEKTGSTFNGWYTENTFQNKKESITLNDFQNFTLYAKWSN